MTPCPIDRARWSTSSNSDVKANDLVRHIRSLAEECNECSQLTPEALSGAAHVLLSSTYRVSLSTTVMQPIGNPVKGDFNYTEQRKTFGFESGRYYHYSVLSGVSVAIITIFCYGR